jgi:hypothetical protein
MNVMNARTPVARDSHSVVPPMSGASTVTTRPPQNTEYVRLEVFTAVTMKNGVFWDDTPCGSCKNRRFGGT